MLEEVPLSSSTPAKILVDTFQQEAQSKISVWSGSINQIRAELKRGDGPTAYDGLERPALLKRINDADEQLSQLQGIIAPVVQHEYQVQEILKMKRTEAEFQTVVVGAFPPDRLSELFGTMSVALVGGGGAAYALYSASLVPALALWVFGGITLGLTIAFRWSNQSKHMKLYADRLESL
jgi:hypothetical protein